MKHQPADKVKEAEEAAIEPGCVRISTAVKLTGPGRSSLYELIRSGELGAVKVGGSSVIPFPGRKRLEQVKS